MKIAESYIFNNDICMDIISTNKKWFYSEKFIDCFSNKVDWKWIIKNIELKTFMLDRYYDILKKIYINEDLYDYSFSFMKNISSMYIYQNLNDSKFLKKHENTINWIAISKYQKKLSEKQILIFSNKLYFEYIFHNYKLSMKTLNRLSNNIIIKNINTISFTQNLDKNYIIKHNNILNPYKLIINKNLSISIKDNICEIGKTGKYIFLKNNKQYINF